MLAGRLAEMTADIQSGRSTDGPAAKNDVENIVIWKSQRRKDKEK